MNANNSPIKKAVAVRESHRMMVVVVVVVVAVGVVDDSFLGAAWPGAARERERERNSASKYS